MARADLLLELADAGLAGDLARTIRALRTLAADESQKRHTLLAGQLEALAEEGERTRTKQPMLGDIADRTLRPERDKDGARKTRRSLASVELSRANRTALNDLIEEHRHGLQLLQHGIAPRNRVLLTGPPGTGKTSLAEALATELDVRLITARYESLIGSLLGSTGAELRRLFEDAAAGPSLLFFDEFDTIAKERADSQDSGEMKRVVSSLMLSIDALPASVVLVAASNHPEMLDRAIWRRFQVHLDLPLPARGERRSFARRRAKELHLTDVDRLMEKVESADGEPYSWVEQEVVAARRSEILQALRQKRVNGGTEWQTLG